MSKIMKGMYGLWLWVYLGSILGVFASLYAMGVFGLLACALALVVTLPLCPYCVRRQWRRAGRG